MRLNTDGGYVNVKARVIYTVSPKKADRSGQEYINIF